MLGHLWTNLFQIWYDDIHYETLQFDSSLDDFDVNSRSQGYGKAGLVHSFFCEVAWSNSDVHDSWLRKGNDCEEDLKCGEYGLFELLLFFILLCCNSGRNMFQVYTGDLTDIGDDHVKAVCLCVLWSCIYVCVYLCVVCLYVLLWLCVCVCVCTRACVYGSVSVCVCTFLD